MTAKNSEIDVQHKPLELSEEAKFFQDYCSRNKITRFYTIPHCANIIARLHAEGKSIEQIKSGLPFLNERDSDLAVHCISRLLNVLDWGAFS